MRQDWNLNWQVFISSRSTWCNGSTTPTNELSPMIHPPVFIASHYLTGVHSTLLVNNTYTNHFCASNKWSALKTSYTAQALVSTCIVGLLSNGCRKWEYTINNCILLYLTPLPDKRRICAGATNMHTHWRKESIVKILPVLYEYNKMSWTEGLINIWCAQ